MAADGHLKNAEAWYANCQPAARIASGNPLTLVGGVIVREADRHGMRYASSKRSVLSLKVSVLHTEMVQHRDDTGWTAEHPRWWLSAATVLCRRPTLRPAVWCRLC